MDTAGYLMNSKINASTHATTYDYSNDYESDLCNQENVIRFGASLTIIFFSFVIVFSVFGNVLVLVILFKYENVKCITNTLILNLAVSDLFFTSALPIWAQYHMEGWTLGEHACHAITFVFYVGFYSSGFFLILMTIHRYIAVMNPLSSIVSTTGPSGIITSIFVWIASILAASPVFIFSTVLRGSDSSSSIPKDYCGFRDSSSKKFEIYEQNVLFVLMAFVFIFCYSQIMCKLMRPTAQKRRNKTVKLIFILMVVFILGWGPYNVAIFLHTFFLGSSDAVHGTKMAEICEQKVTIDYAIYITRFLAFSHCCLNPVFYVFAGVKFKTHLKKLLQKWGHSNNGVSNRDSKVTITSLTSNN